MLNFLDAFSGIGGFALGASCAGLRITNHFFSEVEPYAVQVYRRQFPQAIDLGDIRQISGEALRRQYPGEWIITGGFPCQDISTAGKGRGLHGGRSGLWFEMFRLICELRPSFVVVENVRQLCTKGLDRVLLDLSTIGYDAEWQVLRASQFGLPHRRERLYVVAYPHDFERRGLLQQTPQEVQHLGDGEQGDGSATSPPPRIDWATAVATGQILGQPAVFRVDDGVSTGLDIDPMSPARYREGVMRIAALGNAIVPQAAEAVFRKLYQTQPSTRDVQRLARQARQAHQKVGQGLSPNLEAPESASAHVRMA